MAQFPNDMGYPMKVSVQQLLLTVFAFNAAFAASSSSDDAKDDEHALSHKTERAYQGSSPVDMVQDMISVLSLNGQLGAIVTAIDGVQDLQVKDRAVKRGIRAASQVGDVELLEFLLDQAMSMVISVSQMPRLFQQSLNAAARANNAVVAGALVDYAIASGAQLDQLKKPIAKTIAVAAELDHCLLVGDLIVKAHGMGANPNDLGGIISNGIETATRGGHFEALGCLANNAACLHVPFASVEWGVRRAVQLASKYDREKLLPLLIQWARYGCGDREQLRGILSIGLMAVGRHGSSASLAVLWDSIWEFGFALKDFASEIQRMVRFCLKKQRRDFFRHLIVRILAVSDDDLASVQLNLKAMLHASVRLGFDGEAINLLTRSMACGLPLDLLATNALHIILLACKFYNEGLVQNLMSQVILEHLDQPVIQSAVRSGLGLALSRGFTSLVDYFIETAIEKDLKFTGFSFDMSMDLNVAVRRGYLDAVRKVFRGMLLLGMKPEQFEYGMYGLIYIAATNAHGSMVDFLFNFCIAIHVKDVRSWTIRVMHAACEGGVASTVVATCIAALGTGRSVEDLRLTLVECSGRPIARDLLGVLDKVDDIGVAVLRMVDWCSSSVGNVAVDLIVGRCLFERDWQRLELLIGITNKSERPVSEVVEMVKYCLVGVEGGEVEPGRVKIIMEQLYRDFSGVVVQSLVRQLYVAPRLYGYGHLAAHPHFSRALEPAVEEFRVFQLQ